MWLLSWSQEINCVTQGEVSTFSSLSSYLKCRASYLPSSILRRIKRDYRDESVYNEIRYIRRTQQNLVPHLLFRKIFSEMILQLYFLFLHFLVYKWRCVHTIWSLESLTKLKFCILSILGSFPVCPLVTQNCFWEVVLVTDKSVRIPR